MKVAHSLSGLTVIVAAGCAPAESQSPMVEAQLPGRFAMISNVVELKNGRIAFADTKDKLFFRADLTSGKVDTLGKRVDSLAASAPSGEYRFPGWVAHLAGDTVALVDFSAIRTTLWNESGKPLGVLPIKPVSGNTPILLYDTLGHGYKIDYQAVLGGGEPGRSLRPDSIPVLRFTIKGAAVDTIAMLASPEYGDARFGEQVQVAAVVFSPNDFFGVLPDGTAWVARGRENRVDWRSPTGGWTRGKSHAYTKVRVTQADKDRVLAQVREHGKQFGMPQQLRIEYPFAETKAPFDFALGRPRGEVWLQRPRAEETAALVYDVFDRKGAWTREVALPKGMTLAGFGSSDAVYVSIKNEDGTRTVGTLKTR
jgi:hypothetical protein